MWDYSFGIPSLFIISIILIFYFTLPRLSIRMNKTFVIILIIESAVIFLDIVSAWADENYTQVTVSVLYVLNILYFFFFFARAFAFLLFTANVFRVDPTKSAIRTAIMLLPFIISAVITVSCPLTGLIFRIDETGYHAGNMYNLVYTTSYFYLLMSFYIIFAYKKGFMNKRRWYSMFLYNLVILAGIMIRRMYPSILLMDTFCLMAILVVYLAFQNPEFYLELRGSAFNITAFRDLIDENIKHLNNNLVGLLIHNYYEMRDIYGGRQVDRGVALISRYLAQTFPDCNIFYYRKGRFFILGDKSLSFEKTINTLKERFEEPWLDDDLELYLEADYVTASLTNKVESSDALLNSLVQAMTKSDMLNTGEPVEITEADLMVNATETANKKILEKALDENEVEVFLQAIVDAKTGKIVGAESLARIIDDKGEILPPGVFIPIAEKNGRINVLGEQLFVKLCRFIKNNELRNLGLSWINFNLSPVQFMKNDLAERMSSIIDMYGVAPDVIHLEITEESMIDDGFLRRQIQNLGRIGFKFVLDDYGTGYSNLTRLKKCPFMNVKLDMSVVWDYCNNPDEILPNMVDAFKHMGFSVTAEGIEDEKMAKAMADIGCDFLQGYYYSKPLPLGEFVEKYKN